MPAVGCIGQDGLAAGQAAVPPSDAGPGGGAGPAQAAVQGPSLLLSPAHVPAEIEGQEQGSRRGEC